MSPTEKKIADTLAKFGEPAAGNIWRVQGTAVIYHKALERIAAVAGIRFEDPKILRAERDEAVILVTGEMDVGEVVVGTQAPRPRREWSIGEACIGTNYRVSGKQAAYPFAMAEKRAKDRVILKLIELHGLVYSEEEADEFKESRPTASDAGTTTVEVVENNQPPANDRKLDPDSPAGIEANLKQMITKAKTITAVTDLMLHADTQRDLASLADGIREEIRDFAKARLTELGWPTKKAV